MELMSQLGLCICQPLSQKKLQTVVHVATSVCCLMTQFFKDKKLVENVLSESLAAVHVTQYNGPPCPTDNNPCHNGGLCIPNLNDFECRCVASFSGITCQLSKKSYLYLLHCRMLFHKICVATI